MIIMYDWRCSVAYLIKNLEKYQPQYKDGRRLLWIRWNVNAHRDYKLNKLTPAANWLFVVMICLATENKNQIPEDKDWLSKESGVDKKAIHKCLLMLQTLELIVTDCNNESKSLYPTDRQTDNTNDTNNISQVSDLLNQFSNQIKEKAIVYIERNRLKNKSKVITEGRKQTLLLELYNTKERCGNDELFEKALECSINYDACNIGYVGAIIKNKKAGK